MKTITLWSIQTPETESILRRRWRLRGDGRRAGQWRRSYLWMMAQIAERIPGYRGGYPLWAWY